VTLVAPSHGELDSVLGRKILQNDKVEVLENHRVQAVLGDTHARRLVVSHNVSQHELEADAFFVELELKPRSEAVADLVPLDEMGRIKVDGLNQTGVDGVFAAGDVTDVFAEQVLIAVGEGAKAALTAYDYLLETF
jgi:alkyl hydroperoxide reductase subunit AhpF